jgi:phosphoketolase
MNKEYKIWQKGYGAIKHSPKTAENIQKMLSYLAKHNIKGDGISPYKLLADADRITNAAMWLVIHQTYAKNIYLDGRKLKLNDFKSDPQGHLGACLNMIPAYVGYMLANALTGITRGWVMGQGHAAAAVDSINLLLNNMNSEHAQRYDISQKGLSRFIQDFYSYKLNKSGKQDSPLGSHINQYSAGASLEGGYLGFAALQYVHMPLYGERLVAFLSDGAFEEQRGSDWVPRWWRAEDCGLIAPIMIFNGRPY